MDNENKRYDTVCGEVIYHSRSVAVCVHVYAVVDGGIYVAVLRRGEGMDHGGMWCMPCGYLDWNETTAEGAKREVREELGLSSEALGELDFITIDDSADAYKQNVTVAYRAQVSGLIELNSAGAAKGEVQEVKWMNVSNLQAGGAVWAFDHDKKIIQDVALIF